MVSPVFVELQLKKVINVFMQSDMPSQTRHINTDLAQVQILTCGCEVITKVHSTQLSKWSDP